MWTVSTWLLYLKIEKCELFQHDFFIWKLKYVNCFNMTFYLKVEKCELFRRNKNKSCTISLSSLRKWYWVTKIWSQSSLWQVLAFALIKFQPRRGGSSFTCPSFQKSAASFSIISIPKTKVTITWCKLLKLPQHVDWASVPLGWRYPLDSSSWALDYFLYTFAI